MNASLTAWLRLIRIWNVLLSGAAAIVGAVLGGGEVNIGIWLLVPLAPMLITAAGNIHNDLCDIKIDRVNRPERPLASGVVQVRTARLTTLLLYVTGVISAGFLGWIPLIMGSLVVGLLIVYNTMWARLPGIGNISVAALGALPVVYGGVSASVGSLSTIAVPAAAALVAFWLHLAREILKDVTDASGDQIAGRLTLPIAYGHRIGMRLGALAMLLAAASAVWLGTEGWLGPIYVYGICVTVIPALLLGAAQCWWRPELPIASLWAGWIKIIMLAGLVWMLLGMRR